MSSYELIFLHSIPFLVKPGENKLYYYDAHHIGDGTEPINLGTYTGTTFTLSEGWQERIQPRVDAFRGTLKPSERGVVQPRAPKPSKPKRTPAKAAKAATGTGTTVATVTTVATNDIIHPVVTGEVLPLHTKSRKGRPAGTRTGAQGVSRSGGGVV